MDITQRNFVSLCLGLFIVLMPACEALPFRAPTPTAIKPTPTPIKPTPTLFANYDAGPPFDCWTEAAPQQPELRSSGDLFLVINGSKKPGRYLDLYQYRLEERAYELIATNLQMVRIGRTMLSPARDAFWHLAEGPSREDQIYVYRLASGILQEIPIFYEDLVPPTAYWSTNGSCLLFIDRGELVAYRLADGKLQRKKVPGVDPLANLAVSPGGRWWVTSHENGIILFDLEGNRFDSPAFRVGQYSGNIRWSPDGRMLAFAYEWNKYRTGGYYQVRLIFFQPDGSILHTEILNDFDRRVNELLWSPDSRFLYLDLPMKPHLVKVYDVHQMQIKPLSVGIETSDRFCLSPDGKQIFVARQDLEKGEELFIFDLNSLERYSLPFPAEYVGDDSIYIDEVYWLSP